MAYPYENLRAQGFEPVVYFFNPNIFPQEEHDRRCEELVNYCEKKGIEYFVEKGSHDEWLDFIKGYESEPEKGLRCEKCFEFRLEKAVQKAKELNIEDFTTTLSVSPHKDSDVIFETGQKVSIEYGLTFLKENFKKENGFLKTMKIAKENDFYRQSYCGCEFSLKKNN